MLRNSNCVAKLKCIQPDGCGEFQYFDASNATNKNQTVGGKYRFEKKAKQRSLSCGCSSKHTKYELIENMTTRTIAKDLAELKAEQEESKDAKPPAKKKSRHHK